jgi:hypothetical protein
MFANNININFKIKSKKNKYIAYNRKKKKEENVFRHYIKVKVKHRTSLAMKINE